MPGKAGRDRDLRTLGVVVTGDLPDARELHRLARVVHDMAMIASKQLDGAHAGDAETAIDAVLAALPRERRQRVRATLEALSDDLGAERAR